jgi:hypothetical protein
MADSFDKNNGLRFYPLPAPSDDDVLALLHRVSQKIEKLARKNSNAQDTVSLPDGQGELYAAATQGKSASGTRAGRSAAKLGVPTHRPYEPDEGPLVSPRNVRLDSYSLHANVAIHANDRQGLERLARYLARGPISTKRFSLRSDGRLAYTLKRPWRDGTAAIAMTRREFLERLAAQVPRPREHLTRYAGVLAPNHSMRRLVCRDRESVREEERAAVRQNLHQRVRHAIHGLPSTAALSCEPLPSPKWKWSELLKRVFKIDVF